MKEKEAEAERELMEITWVWNRTLWTERNRQRWASEFEATFHVYWSETQIRASRDPGMNSEMGTSWVTLALDVCCTPGIQHPAARGGWPW